MHILHRSHDYLLIELTRPVAALIGGSLHVYNTAREFYLKSVPDGTVELANAFLWQGTLDAFHKRHTQGWVTRAFTWLRTRLGRAGGGVESPAVLAEGTEVSRVTGTEEASTATPSAITPTAADTRPTPGLPPPREVVGE